jgi:hypothetical protein
MTINVPADDLCPRGPEAEMGQKRRFLGNQLVSQPIVVPPLSNAWSTILAL